jgi:arabinan endo-1,5-alpha-L-arabinosidase
MLLGALVAVLLAGHPVARAPRAYLGRGDGETERRSEGAFVAPSPRLTVPPSLEAPPSRATFRNPVLDSDFPDPTVLRAADGWYYAYATQTIGSKRKTNLSVARSRDLIRWELLPDALPRKPVWASTTQNFWAPHPLQDRGTYYLYFSAEPDTRDGMCLGVATASSPAGPFTDSGAPLKRGRGFAAIDPMAFDDSRTGKKFLYWGSGGEPIQVQELASDRLRFAPDSEPIPLLQPGKAPYERLVEGAFVIYRNGFYYLFYSGDNCCAPPAHYAVMVARSKSATGPFQKLGEATGKASSVILEQNARWLAPGHNSVLTDTAGQDWIVYHAIDPRHPFIPGTRTTRRAMLIDRLVYRDGWPRVPGGTPSIGPQTAPAILPGLSPGRRHPTRDGRRVGAWPTNCESCSGRAASSKCPSPRRMATTR